MKLSKETEKFLRDEAKGLFKRLSLSDQRRLGSYKMLYLELKQAWRRTGDHITVDNIKEFVWGENGQ